MDKISDDAPSKLSWLDVPKSIWYFLGENKRKLSLTDISLRAILNKNKWKKAHFNNNKMEQTPVE